MGILTFANGDKYVSDFNDDKLSGQGTCAAKPAQHAGLVFGRAASHDAHFRDRNRGWLSGPEFQGFLLLFRRLMDFRHAAGCGKQQTGAKDHQDGGLHEATDNGTRQQSAELLAVSEPQGKDDRAEHCQHDIEHFKGFEDGGSLFHSASLPPKLLTKPTGGRRSQTRSQDPNILSAIGRALSWQRRLEGGGPSRWSAVRGLAEIVRT
jgi:hypothetical protein